MCPLCFLTARQQQSGSYCWPRAIGPPWAPGLRGCARRRPPLPASASAAEQQRRGEWRHR
eukprot:8645215-Pyramimonas_sp.AAC.1